MVHPTECANKVICDRRIIPHALYLITEVARNKLSGISVPDAQHFASKNLTDLVGRKATRVILGNVPVAGEQAASATFGDVHVINLACGPPHGQGLVTFKTGAGAEHAETLFTFLGASDGQGQVLAAARSRRWQVSAVWLLVFFHSKTESWTERWNETTKSASRLTAAHWDATALPRGQGRKAFLNVSTQWESWVELSEKVWDVEPGAFASLTGAHVEVMAYIHYESVSRGKS